MILFNVLCNVYCERGCVSLESEKEKGKKSLRTTEQRTGRRTTGIRGSLRGLCGPKNRIIQRLVESGFPGPNLALHAGFAGGEGRPSKSPRH